MRLEMIGGRLDGEFTRVFWPKVGAKHEFTLERNHVYEVQHRRPAGRGGLVLRHVKSYRPATEASER